MSKLYSQGANGADVKEIQAALNFQLRRPHVPLMPDGIFGPLTDDRTRMFQKKTGLVVDGIIGPKTLGRLYTRIAGVTVIDLVPTGPTGPGGLPRYNLLPASGLPIGGLPLGPRRKPDAVVTKNAPKPKKAQVKHSKSSGFDVKSQVVIDPLADGKKSPKVQYKITLNQEIPWPVLLPKPAKLTFDVKSSPLTSEYSMSGKLKIPFKEFQLPPFALYKSGSLTPYFFTGAGVKKDGFDKLNAGVGAALKIKLIELPHRPYLPIVSVSADGGYKYNMNFGDRKIEGKGYFQSTFGLEWHLF